MKIIDMYKIYTRIACAYYSKHRLFYYAILVNAF